jgi:hypothetical protein
MSHGRRHRQRGKQKKAFDVTPTPVTPVTPVTPAADTDVSAPSTPEASHGGGGNDN